MQPEQREPSPKRRATVQNAYGSSSMWPSSVSGNPFTLVLTTESHPTQAKLEFEAVCVIHLQEWLMNVFGRAAFAMVHCEFLYGELLQPVLDMPVVLANLVAKVIAA